MKKVITIVICDICHEDVTNSDWRNETVNGVEKNYCLDCLHRHGLECDTCLDYFIDLAAHLNKYE